MAEEKKRLGMKDLEDFSPNFGEGTVEKVQAGSKGQSPFSKLMY